MCSYYLLQKEDKSTQLTKTANRKEEVVLGKIFFSYISIHHTLLLEIIKFIVVFMSGVS